MITGVGIVLELDSVLLAADSTNVKMVQGAALGRVRERAAANAMKLIVGIVMRYSLRKEESCDLIVRIFATNCYSTFELGLGGQRKRLKHGRLYVTIQPV